MGRTESPHLKNDYERACGWYGHFNKSEMALFSECTDRYAQKLLDTADIVREAIFRQSFRNSSPRSRETNVRIYESNKACGSNGQPPFRTFCGCNGGQYRSGQKDAK